MVFLVLLVKKYLLTFPAFAVRIERKIFRNTLQFFISTTL